MSEELKPCPFCGGKAYFERHGTPRQSCIIECGSCGCRLESSEEGSRCGSMWNRRAEQGRSVNAQPQQATDADALRRDNNNLRTVMIAAAEEIHAHWAAHCDAEGYGPVNLMHRLEEGIPSEYGYTAGAFAALKAAQADEIAAAVAFERERCAALCEMWNTSPGSSLAKEIRGGAEAGKPQAEPVADELGWLLEMRPSENLLWWDGGFDVSDDYPSKRLFARMVNDVNKAVRFSRREDAQCVLDAMLAVRPSPLFARASTLYSVQEHMWHSTAQPQQAAAQPCQYCNDTGDVHGLDGEWRGRCTACAWGAAQAEPVAFDHGIGADRYRVVKGSFWWHVRIGDSTANVGKFHSELAAENMALKLLTAFRDGAFMQSKAAQPQQASQPVAWLVIDEDSMPVYAAPWKEAAHEHINDAINEHDIAEARNWKVLPAYAHPPAAQPQQAAAQPVAWMVINADGAKSLFDDEQEAYAWAAHANGPRPVHSLFTGPSDAPR